MLAFLPQDHDQISLGQRRFDHTVPDKPGDGRIEIGAFFIFPFVDPFGIILANPLAPAMEDKLASLPDLFPWSREVTDEEKMCGKAQSRQRSRQVIDADAKSPSHAVSVRPFKAQDDDVGILRSNVVSVHSPISAGPH